VAVALIPRRASASASQSSRSLDQRASRRRSAPWARSSRRYWAAAASRSA